METASGTRFWIERDNVLTKKPLPQKETSAMDTLVTQKAELFLALVEKVNEPRFSYIRKYSWLFGQP